MTAKKCFIFAFQFILGLLAIKCLGLLLHVPVTVTVRPPYSTLDCWILTGFCIYFDVTLIVMGFVGCLNEFPRDTESCREDTETAHIKSSIELHPLTSHETIILPSERFTSSSHSTLVPSSSHSSDASDKRVGRRMAKICTGLFLILGSGLLLMLVNSVAVYDWLCFYGIERREPPEDIPSLHRCRRDTIITICVDVLLLCIGIATWLARSREEETKSVMQSHDVPKDDWDDEEVDGRI